LSDYRKKKWGVALPCGMNTITLVAYADDEGDAADQLLAQARELRDLLQEWIAVVDRRYFYRVLEGAALPNLTFDLRQEKRER
jgi:hypothetical protein